MNLTLTFFDKNSEAQSIELPPGSYVVGCDEDRCDVTTSDPSVSEQHCRLEFEGGHWSLSDLASTSGTTVNGVAVPVVSTQQLDNLDQIQIGEVIMDVHLDVQCQRTKAESEAHDVDGELSLKPRRELSEEVRQFCRYSVNKGLLTQYQCDQLSQFFHDTGVTVGYLCSVAAIVNRAGSGQSDQST